MSGEWTSTYNTAALDWLTPSKIIGNYAFELHTDRNEILVGADIKCLALIYQPQTESDYLIGILYAYGLSVT